MSLYEQNDRSIEMIRVVYKTFDPFINQDLVFRGITTVNKKLT